MVSHGSPLILGSWRESYVIPRGYAYAVGQGSFSVEKISWNNRLLGAVHYISSYQRGESAYLYRHKNDENSPWCLEQENVLFKMTVLDIIRERYF